MFEIKLMVNQNGNFIDFFNCAAKLPVSTSFLV